MQGNASVSIGALAALSATANLSGEALAVITSSGTIEVAGEPIPADVSGAVTIAITSTGKLPTHWPQNSQPNRSSMPDQAIGSDAGTGYRYIDRALVKGLKVVKIGTTWQSTGSVKSGGLATPLVRIHRTKAFGGTVRSTSHWLHSLHHIYKKDLIFHHCILIFQKISSVIPKASNKLMY